MGAPKVDVWNLALSRLGIGPVTLDTEDSVKAKTLSRLWLPAIRDTLRSAPFGCARVIAAGTQLANYTPPPGFAYGYQYPPKAANVWKCYNQPPAILSVDDWGNPVYEKIRGNVFFRLLVPDRSVHVLVTNVQDAYFDYTYQLEDPSLFDDALINAIAFRLAADAAMPLTGDPNYATTMTNGFNLAISEAKRLAYAENNQGATGQSSTLDSRA